MTKKISKLEHKIRAGRLKDFIDNYLDLFALNYDVSLTDENKHQYTFWDTGFEDFDYYPKADKLFFHTSERWQGDGLHWMKNNLKMQ